MKPVDTFFKRTECKISFWLKHPQGNVVEMDLCAAISDNFIEASPLENSSISILTADSESIFKMMDVFEDLVAGAHHLKQNGIVYESFEIHLELDGLLVLLGCQRPSISYIVSGISRFDRQRMNLSTVELMFPLEETVMHRLTFTFSGIKRVTT